MVFSTTSKLDARAGAGAGRCAPTTESVASPTAINTQTIVVFYVTYVIARGFSSATVTGVVSQTLAANWFRRMRGRAFGLMSMSVPLGGSFAASGRVLGQALLVAVVLGKREPRMSTEAWVWTLTILYWVYCIYWGIRGAIVSKTASPVSA